MRSPSELAPEPVDLDDSEIEEALLLIESMTRQEPIEDAEWASDRYTAALEDVICAKAAGRRPPKAEEAEAPIARAVDLIAALEQSVAQARKSRGDGGDATVHEMPKKASAKKTAAKKTNTKKTAAKKATAKKTRKSA